MKYKSIGLRFLKNTLDMHILPLIKLYNFRKRKITHHHMPNSIYACILSHEHWKSPEMAWVINIESPNIFHQKLAKKKTDKFGVILGAKFGSN